jgi:hypothetical protein
MRDQLGLVMKHIFTGALLLMMGACSSHQHYTGAARAETDIAMIRGISNLDVTAKGWAAKVCSIDDQPFLKCKPDVDMLPGKHKLLLQTSRFGLAVRSEEVTMEFKAGDKYVLGINFLPTGDGVPMLIGADKVQ